MPVFVFIGLQEQKYFGTTFVELRLFQAKEIHQIKKEQVIARMLDSFFRGNPLHLREILLLLCWRGNSDASSFQVTV